jgi:hypothetical protein
MQVEDELLKREKELLLEMLFNREIAPFESYVAHENSHDVSRSLTDLRISDSQNVD